MCTQGMLLSVSICGFFAVTPAPVIAAADPGTEPIMQSAASVDHRRSEGIPWLTAGTMASTPVCANPAAGKRDNRAYLNTRPGPGENLPSEELRMPRVFDLARVPFGRTIPHPLSPNVISPTPEHNEILQNGGPVAPSLC